jgi:hypothetical protein
VCGTWSLTVKEVHGLRVTENRALRRIPVPVGDEIIGDWRNLYNEVLHYFCSSPDIIRMIKFQRM